MIILQISLFRQHFFDRLGNVIHIFDAQNTFDCCVVLLHCVNFYVFTNVTFCLLTFPKERRVTALTTSTFFASSDSVGVTTTVCNTKTTCTFWDTKYHHVHRQYHQKTTQVQSKASIVTVASSSTPGYYSSNFYFFRNYVDVVSLYY